MRLNRWAKSGVLERVFWALQAEGLTGLEVFSLDSTAVKVHPDAHGASKKNGKQAIGKSRGGWNTKINALVAGDRVVVGFSLSPGNAVDGGGGRLLLAKVGPREGNCKLLMDRGYEDEQTRLIARELGYTPVVPPKSNRRHPWEYDRELYKRRNEVERFFRRLKAFRCVATRYEKLDVMFTAFILIAIISISLSNVNTP